MPCGAEAIFLGNELSQRSSPSIDFMINHLWHLRHISTERPVSSLSLPLPHPQGEGSDFLGRAAPCFSSLFNVSKWRGCFPESLSLPLLPAPPPHTPHHRGRGGRGTPIPNPTPTPTPTPSHRGGGLLPVRGEGAERPRSYIWRHLRGMWRQQVSI